MWRGRGLPRPLPGGEGLAVGGSRSLHRELLGYIVKSHLRLFSRIQFYGSGLKSPAPEPWVAVAALEQSVFLQICSEGSSWLFNALIYPYFVILITVISASVIEVFRLLAEERSVCSGCDTLTSQHGEGTGFQTFVCWRAWPYGF